MKSPWTGPGAVRGVALVAAATLTFTLTFTLAYAQQDEDDPAAPPPIPRKVPNEDVEPSVVITEKEGERIEEYSRDGRVYMVKITPIKGAPYWYLDEDGDGQLELRDPDNGQGRVRPVYWKLKKW